MVYGNLRTECCFNEHVESAERVRFTTPFFVLDKARSIPITIGSQTAWEAIRNDFIEKRSRIRSRRRSVQPPRHIDEDFFLWSEQFVRSNFGRFLHLMQ